jgi:hypothetical protein
MANVGVFRYWSVMSSVLYFFLSMLKEYCHSEILVIQKSMLKVDLHTYGVWFILKFKQKIMIKVNELRIGNYVQYENKHSDRCTTKVSYSDFRNLTYEVNFKDFYTVELTEEWLLKAGFKLSMANFNWNAAIGENEIGDFKLALRYCERIGWFFQSKCTIIKYVHQLQNLFFCITGEELVFSSTEP